jgi:hypothetical protein
LVAYRKVYFVDGQFGSSGNTGLSVSAAFDTIQAALDKVVDGDSIIVMSGSSYDEELVTGQQAKTAVASVTEGRGRYVSLIGASPTIQPYDSPQLYNVSGATATLFVRSPGWRVSGFRIVGDSGSPICVKAQMAQQASTADTNWAPGLQIDNCVFYGAVGNTSGLSLKANTDFKILNNKFHLFATASLGAIVDEGGGSTFAARGEIAGNIFEDNVANITYAFKACSIHHNVIGNNQVNTMTTGIDMQGGGQNAIFANQFGGIYASGGVYTAGSAGSDNWVGNFATAGNGVTGGITTGDPGQ